MTVLVRNRRQAIKVRAVLLASAVAAALAVWGGWSIWETFGLNQADGGVLRPAWERAMLGAGVGLLGLAFFAGMVLFASLYVLRLELAGDAVAIDVMSLTGRRRHSLARADVGAGAYHHGRLATRRAPSVDAPWITLRVRGRRLPFVIDLQAEEIEIGPLSVLAAGAVGDWQADRG